MSVARITATAALVAIVVGVAGLDELAAPLLEDGWLAAAGFVIGLLHCGALAALAASCARVLRPRPRALTAVSGSCLAGYAVPRIPEPWLGGRGPPAPVG
jgi:hypothetical protein